MTERNYYDILGLRFDADGTAVNRTYWLLARKYQALAGSDPRAHQMLDELNEAYGVLGTPSLRVTYDNAHPELARIATTETWRERDGDLQAADAFMLRTTVDSGPGTRVDIKALAPYAAAALIGLAGIGVGLATGSMLLAGLGAGGAILLGAAYARLKLASAPRARTDRYVEAAAKVNPGPIIEQPPLSATIARRRNISADELRLSTASMVGRWRSAAVVADPGDGASNAPDPTLVDIFRSEDEVERSSEPLSAVLDVLRGSRQKV